MLSIVKQFRALKGVRPIANTYWFGEQKYAYNMFLDCTKCVDDEKLLEMLHDHAFTFVDALQSFAPNTLPKWRVFLRELINDVINNAAFIYDADGFPDWRDQSRKLIAFTRLGYRAKFDDLNRLIMNGIDRLPIVASFASDCKNVLDIGKMLPNITRNIVETNGTVSNVVVWLNLVEIYTRQYQGRVLYQREQYPELIAHLAKYKCESRDQFQLTNTKTVDRESAAYGHAMFFLERVKQGDLHLAATFLCDNINTIAQFRYMSDKRELSFSFERSIELAAFVLKEKLNMNNEIQQTAKPKANTLKLADLAKKLIADWEC